MSGIPSKNDAPAALEYEFCPKCGGALRLRPLKEGERERLVCSVCDFIFFLDPKVAAGTIFKLDGRIILARRAIEPGYGKWVFPGGFVERGETVEAAAVREAREEMNVEVKLLELLNVYSYPAVPIVVIVFSAEMTGGRLQAADESLEVRGFVPEDIPWSELAFSSIHDALRDYVRLGVGPGPA